MSDFITFVRALGIVIDTTPPIGRWVRLPTLTHPRKRNGAVKFMGDHGFAQEHSTMTSVAIWKPDGAMPQADRQAVAARAAEHEKAQQMAWRRAAMRAGVMLAESKLGEHNYLHRKGFKDALGLVLPDGSLMVPMRSLERNELVGAQIIAWDVEERRFTKKMLPGMRAKLAVFRIGPKSAAMTFLCEGYATGITVEQAARLMRLSAAVLVCFSAGNLVQVAPLVRGRAIVVADNDESGTGQAAAERTGLPWCMPETVGQDANDMHAAAGLFEVGAMLISAREPAVSACDVMTGMEGNAYDPAAG